MNYRHAFHAGNFADVFKHALLVRILMHLQAKDTAYRYLDTHAGAGLYDLESGPGARTREADAGIRRLRKANLPADAALLLEPYLRIVAAVAGSENRLYPGSPEIAARLARPQDRLTLVELHPEDHAALHRQHARDRRIATVQIDGWLAWKAYVPPAERRGLVLVDPPFEAPGEYDRLVDGLRIAAAKWTGGIFALWYPIKDAAAVRRFADALREAAIPKTLRLELVVDPGAMEERLAGCGLIVVNPPWTLKSEAEIMLPVLCRILSRQASVNWRADWLVPEPTAPDRSL